MKIHFIQHESYEAPGAIELWARERNYQISYTRLYQGEALPQTVSDIDFLFVMGGPQSPATTLRECPYFNAQKEIAFIKTAIDESKLVLGICLGAQLVGEALGAKFDHSPNKEIGVFEITMTKESKNDPVFTTFPDKFPVGHWHGDMPGLTPESQIMAASSGCLRQIVKYTPKVYGFQCHFEFTAESIEGMIQNSAEELRLYKLLPFVEDAVTLRSHDFTEMNRLLSKFLDTVIAGRL